MAEGKSRRKKHQNGAIAVMLTLILLILCSTALMFLPEEEPKKKTSNSVPSVTPGTDDASVPEQTEVLAVVLETDAEIKVLTVYDVEAGEQKKLVYTGATVFYDGYGIQLTAGQLKKGDMYRFLIDTKEECVMTAYEAVDRREKPESTKVWEKTDIDYMTVSDGRLSFRGQNYRYADGLCVISNGKKITLSELEPTVDIMTIRGVGQTVYEIIVTKGHGYISLENEEDFFGGVITIGSTRVDSIYENAVYMVREGTYYVSVECGEYAGSEEVVVERDATSVFDVFAYGSGPVQKGWLTIKVDPLGADLYINGKKTAYTDGVELAYGTYQFEFSEGGYVSYKATVQIDQPRQSLSVFLTEQEVSGETTEDDPTKDPSGGSVADGTTGGTTGDTTGTTGSDGTTESGFTGIMTSVSVERFGYEVNRNNAIYILGPDGAEIYLDGEYLGTAPMDFEKIIGSYVITVIRADGAVKNFNCSETDNGSDSYYNFSWTN